MYTTLSRWRLKNVDALFIVDLCLASKGRSGVVVSALDFRSDSRVV